ncbi:MobF family relaxase [Arthrobacter sp. NPDC056691]|uniref:MobF family relaxase n=1 Tax=Arthrobacter sp. NPDC056691 TaxID=3345913 RepID=UPI00366F9ABF
MTMSIARLSAQSGLKYLFKTTMMDDLRVTPADATTYYMKSGTPPGRWIGSGVQGIGRSTGDVVTETDAKAVFDHAAHPDIGTLLGRPHGQPTLVQRSGGRTEMRHAVVGFDLTFSVPKSVSVLWALSPRSIQDQILETHHQAVAATLQWLEASVVHTRAGRNGVAHIGTRGAIAAAFDHWESRAGDPQLHTHMVIANRIQRITDGAWVTLDSRTLYKAAVAASERYNGLLFDALSRNLGTETDFRKPAANTHNPSQQLTGVDDGLIREFSNRSRLIDLETDRLVAEWTAGHGTPPSATTIIKLRQQATLSTRAAKSETVAPLHELSAQWQKRAISQGFSPSHVLAATVRRSHRTPFCAPDFAPSWIDAVGSLARERVAMKRATWNRWNLLAEAERVCAEIRCKTAEDRKAMIDAVATAAETQSVSLNERRYTVPVNAHSDLHFAGHSVFDFQGSHLFTDAGTLAAEDAVMDARNDDGGPAVCADVTMESLANYKHHGRLELHLDQRAAAATALVSGNHLDAIVGPAGTGKTTTLGAVKAAWETAFGAGTVVGLAPAAASAEVLGRELALTTENVAKWLHESAGQGAGNRAAQFFDVEQRLTRHQADRNPHAVRLAQKAAWLTAEQDRWRFHRNQLIVVDEASMVSTLQLAALVQQARDAGAKVLLVGDPGQLDAIDAGGILGWLDRQGKTSRLTTIWRFEQAWEQGASLMLRSGDFSAVAEYNRHGRLRHGSYPDMVDQAYLSWQADIKAGKSSILIAAENDTVSMLNRRAQADRVIQGDVDAEQAVPICDGSRAGRGDSVIARQNDRTNMDSNGDFIRNGTMLDVVRVDRRNGSLTAVRRDTGATISLTRAYVESSVELGYATTAHRSQGLTVDTGHTLVTQSRLTRELLYVSMTRGRVGNHAYISENDPLEDEPLDPALQATWQQILGEVLAAEGAERTAHEVRDAERTKADSLQRLSAEFDYLAQIAAAEDLSAFLEAYSPDSVAELQQSPSWGATVAAWRRSVQVSRPSTQRVVKAAMGTSESAKDLAAVVHSRLRRFLTAMPVIEEDPLAPVNSARPDLAHMVDQIQERIRQRMDNITRDAFMHDPGWKRNLVESLGPDIRSEDAHDIVRRVAIFRDRWGVGDSPLPLGPVPAPYEWEQREQRAGIDQLIGQLALPLTGQPQGNCWVGEPVTQADSLINVGWQL